MRPDMHLTGTEQASKPMSYPRIASHLSARCSIQKCCAEDGQRQTCSNDRRYPKNCIESIFIPGPVVEWICVEQPSCACCQCAGNGSLPAAYRPGSQHWPLGRLLPWSDHTTHCLQLLGTADVPDGDQQVLSKQIACLKTLTLPQVKQPAVRRFIQAWVQQQSPGITTKVMMPTAVKAIKHACRSRDFCKVKMDENLALNSICSEALTSEGPSTGLSSM